MNDDNWEVINGPAAHHIEQLNGVNTVNVIEALITLLTSLRPPSPSTVPLMPSEAALRELHRTGTIFLLNQPGNYRDCPVHVQDAAGNIVYQPPPPLEVPEHMTEFFKELLSIWHSGDALDAAAFALWRINWVHPFKNGNGRTARSFAYCCLCARLGVVLPGAPTVIDQIMTTRAEYEAAIRVGDAAAANGNGRDLSAMKTYLNDLLQIQIASVP
jgi:Fic family protein